MTQSGQASQPKSKLRTT